MRKEPEDIIKISKKKIVFAVILIAFISLLSVSYLSISNEETEPTVYVQSKLGCLPLEYPYTDSQWEASQNLYKSLNVPILQRCNP